MSNCRVVSVLEPDEDVLVGNEGSLDAALQENGFVNLSIGQQEVVVNFATQKWSNDYEFSALYVENDVDPNPMDIEPVPVARTVSGFTLELTGFPDTVNYALYWRVKVRAAGTASMPSPTPAVGDPPQSLYTPLTQGASTQTIPFSIARSVTTYGFSELRVENLIDGPGQTIIWVQVTGKTKNDFTIAINPPPPTANYFLVIRSP
jgi:hypothetical protein